MVRSFKKKIAILFFALLLILIAVFATSCLRWDTLVDDPVVLSTADNPGTESQPEESFTESITSSTMATSEITTTNETQSETEDTTTPAETDTLTTTKKTTAKQPTTTKKPTTTKPSTTTKKTTVTEPVTTIKTTTTSTTTTTPPAPYYKDNYAQQVLALVNAERAKVGKPPYTMNSSLVANAKVRAKEFSDNPDLGHTRPNGQPGYTIITISHSHCGENLAAGQATPERVVQGWMGSMGHRALLLDDLPDDERGFTQVGISCYYVPGSMYIHYWVLLAIAP